MRYNNSYILAAVLILSAVARAGEPVLELRQSAAAVRNTEQFTKVPFTIHGPYSGDIEFFQYESVKYFKAIEQKTDAPAEYEAAIPAVFESIPFTVRAGPVSRTLDTRRMDIISGVDPEISRLFGSAEIELAVRVKAAAIVMLYLVCVVIILRSGNGVRRAAALAAATVLFSAAELFLLGGGVKEMSVALREGKTGGVSYSYEFVGVGCPLGGKSGLARQAGVIFPVHETIQGLFGDRLRIRLAGEGSSVKDFPLSRGKYRIFCSMSRGGLGGEIAIRDGKIVNLTGFDMAKAFLWRKGQLFALGELPNGCRSDPRSAGIIPRTDVLEEAEKRLVPAASKLLSWRMKWLDSADVVFGFTSSSHVLFFEVNLE